MRMGSLWSEQAIDRSTRQRIEKLINGEWDEKIIPRVYEKTQHYTSIDHFKGLPEWIATYVVYNRHAEAQEVSKWETPAELDHFIRRFKQHSMRNPIVEQVILETLRTVRDIWSTHGQIDRIHVEMGREMKNPADVRKRMTETITNNEETNLRIKHLLQEFKDPDFEIEDVRPYSPHQQEILRIYEDTVLQSVAELPEEYQTTLKKFRESDTKKQPTKSEVLRYKLWLEQKYRSPYTGDPISLSKLFTSAYEIEHIIPRSLYYDDSFSNKVICESEVNKLK